MTHPEHCNALVDDMIQSNAQLSLLERELALPCTTVDDFNYRAAVWNLYHDAMHHHGGLMRRWSEALFESAPVRFDDAAGLEEEWTPDNAAFGDPGSRHHY